MARYGHSTGEETQLVEGGPRLHCVAFRTHQYNIQVEFLNGRSAVEIYSKRDGTPFSKREIASLLASNSKGHKWVADHESNFWQQDNGAEANYSPGSGTHPASDTEIAKLRSEGIYNPVNVQVIEQPTFSMTSKAFEDVTQNQK